MFYVNLEPKANNKDIYKCNKIFNSIVKFEPPKKKREIPQCTKCQRYGHTKSYCHHSPRCVKCTGNHKTSDCSRNTRSKEVQCTLCNGNHPANYKGCTVYKELQQKMYPALRKRQTTSQANVVANDVNMPPTNVNVPTGTYSQILKTGTPKDPESSEEPTQPSPPQHEANDLTDLKNMMKVFMEQMFTMLNLLTTVIAKMFNAKPN